MIITDTPAFSVYGFVKQSGGYVDIDSEPGKGTKINIYLPKGEGLNIKPVRSAKKATRINNSGKQVLVIEDNSDVRMTTLKMLKKLGYRTIDGGDGTNLISKIKKAGWRFDLILSDVMLPGISGPALSKKAVSYCEDAKILLMTGYAAKDIMHELVDEKNTPNYDSDIPIIKKPFKSADLAQMVQDVLSDTDEPRLRLDNWSGSRLIGRRLIRTFLTHLHWTALNSRLPRRIH